MASTVGNDTTMEILKKIDQLITEAYTASREYMEDLLQQMLLLQAEIIEEENRLQANSSWTNKFASSLGFSGPKKKNGKSRSDPMFSVSQQSNLAHLSDSKLSKSRSNANISEVDLMAVPSLTMSSPPPKPFMRYKASKGKKSLNQSLNRQGTTVSNVSAKGPTAKVLKQLKTARARFADALEIVKEKAAPFEQKTMMSGSVCGVYNPLTGEIEWREEEDSGLFGVWDPNLQEIIWKEKYNHSICGVYNPIKKEIEWNDIFGGSTCGVFNPTKGAVEWRQMRGSGIFGVYNPDEKAVEWKSYKKGGIIGWFEAGYEKDGEVIPGKVVWETCDKSGICRVSKDYVNGGFKTICCNATNWRW